jgi:hypothetical protein
LLEEIKKEDIESLISESDLLVLEKIQNESYLETKNFVGAFENVGTFAKKDNKVLISYSKYFRESSEEHYKRFIEEMKNREEDI